MIYIKGAELDESNLRLFSADAQEFAAMDVIRSAFVGSCLLALGWGSASAQQVTDVPGSPSATTTIDGKQLPPPDPKFGGIIKEKASDSTPWWAPRVVPPKGAPNVLLIMTDDQGFGAPSTFGGVIPTPAMDRIAKAGLRYTNFHSASLVLADAGGPYHGAQPPLRWLRSGWRSFDGIPRLRLDYPD
ncbi:hypothetical protein ACVWY2_002762 [Bradyrhizobium sp. JR6.1]